MGFKSTSYLQRMVSSQKRSRNEISSFNKFYATFSFSFFFISLEHLLFPKEQNVLSALKQLRETEVSDPITEFSFVCFLKSNYYDLDHDFAPLRGSGGKAPGESGGCRLLRYVTTR